MRGEDAAEPAAEPQRADDLPLPPQRMRSGQCGMAAQIGLDERGEPANLPVGALISGERPYEGGLRVIQLGGNLLHPGSFRPVSGIKQAHARGVSGKGPVGEGVYDVDSHTATISTPITARPSPIR